MDCTIKTKHRFDEERGQWMIYRGGWYPCPKCNRDESEQAVEDGGLKEIFERVRQ
jgi:hypothetical protein